jgi:hypothetical protein
MAFHEMASLPQDDETTAAALQPGPRPHSRVATPAVLRAMMRGSARFIVVTGPAGSGKTALLDALMPLLTQDSLRVFRVEKDQSDEVSLQHLLGRVLEASDGCGALVEEDAARACEILMFPESDDAGTVVAIDDAHTIEPAALRLLDIVSVPGPQGMHPVKILLVGEAGISAVLHQMLPGALPYGAVETLAMRPHAPEAAGACALAPDEPPSVASPLPPGIATAPAGQSVAALPMPSHDARMAEILPAVPLPALRARRPGGRTGLLAFGMVAVAGAVITGWLGFRYAGMAAMSADAMSSLDHAVRLARDALVSAGALAPPGSAGSGAAAGPAAVMPPAPAGAGSREAGTGAPDIAAAPPPGPGGVASDAGPAPAPALSAKPAAETPAAARLPPQVIQALLQRADALLAGGDVFAARLLYERAADAGSAAAATGVGKTFDPEALGRMGVVGLRSDAKAAANWYRRAVALGESEAQVLLDRLGHPAR